MGTSWISRKGGILEKGRVDLEKGGYEPPYQLCASLSILNTYSLPLVFSNVVESEHPEFVNSKL